MHENACLQMFQTVSVYILFLWRISKQNAYSIYKEEFAGGSTEEPTSMCFGIHYCSGFAYSTWTSKISIGPHYKRSDHNDKI